MKKQPEIIVGWREWVALPQLGVPAVKAKIDTGARTSALHADAIEPYTDTRGRRRVAFVVHPLQGDTSVEIACAADLVERRRITDSGGHAELRYVVRTDLALGGLVWPIELSLAGRDAMRFRMLLGRTALSGHAIINPSRSHLTGTDLSGIYPVRKPGRKSKPR